MRIVCIGDSLTSGYKLNRKYLWTSILDEKLDIDVVNKGIAGDTSAGVLSRFKDDVIKYNPSHALIMVATNDFIWKVPIEVVKANIATAIYHSFANNIFPIIGISIPVIPEEAHKNWSMCDDFSVVNDRIAELREWLLLFSKDTNFRVIDFYSYFRDEIEKGNAEVYYSDGVHPSVAGNKLMASVINFND
ncbi:GDSL-type esterase/lipase family protein [Clostridium sp. DL1XJH146]